jgi:tetratricopeptide (TPR) repeat protein
MKKFLPLILSLLVATQFATAQRSMYHQQPESLFNQGKEMFLGGNYVGAQDMLTRFLNEGDDAFLRESAAYMIAVSQFKRGVENSNEVMREFLREHPETTHRHEVNFLIGSYYFDREEWRNALSWLNRADIDFLTLSDQEDHSFRTAYTNLKLGNKPEAARLFGLLAQNSRRYGAAGNFYVGYIEFSQGNIAAAMTRFDRVRNHPDHREDVAFFTAQAAFFEGRIEEAIRLSEAFLTAYPHSRHNGEIFRILGNSNYRLGNINRAITYYERFLATGATPLRGDAYFLGLSYFETGRFADAVRMFQQAIGERDELSQNAQLHLGHTHLRLNQQQQAQMAFQAAARDNFDPQVRETAMFNYALLAHTSNFSVFGESITLFENFLREFPQSQFTNQVNDILAETFLTTRDFNAALAAINRISNPGRRILEARQMVLFQLGAQEFINGNMQQAIQHFNSSIGMGNYDVTARNNAFFWRGEAHYRTGNFASAVTDFQQFTQNAPPSDPNFALGWYSLGYAHFMQLQYTQAIAAFRRYISAETNRNRPEFADAHLRIGDSFFFGRNFAEAERYYAQAAIINPAVADYAMFQRAFVMGLQRNFSGKVSVLDDLMRQFPNSQYFDDALYQKGRALTMLNRENEAISTLQQLLARFPNSPVASQGGIQLGQLFFNIGNYPQSVAAFKTVISNFPGSDDARSALLSLETVYREMNDIQSFVNFANTLPSGMRIAPSRQDSLMYLAAEGQFMRGNRNEAERGFRNYLQNFPNGAFSSDANYHLGVIANERGDRVQALAYFRRVIDASSPRFMDNALIFTSQAEFDRGNFREALADFSRLASVARSTANRQIGQLGVVRSHSRLGNFHEAVRAANELLDSDIATLSPEVVTEMRYLRGKARMQTGEATGAMDDFRAIANDTRSVFGAEAQFLLADQYFRWSEFDRAAAQVQDFMSRGTPHQYWMARAIIVLADTHRARGDDFLARQFLENLRANYQGTEVHIQQMINERLN